MSREDTMEIEKTELIGLLIHARTALKADNSKEALATIRKILDKLDPGRAIEMRMRDGKVAS